MKVQGRDRSYVKYVAEQLDLDGSYIPRTYIEQIQLEKLVNDVMVWLLTVQSCTFMLLCSSDMKNLQALPDDLKTKLSIDDDLVSSPKEALSRASADRRMKYLSRYTLFSAIIWYVCHLKWLNLKKEKGGERKGKEDWIHFEKVKEHNSWGIIIFIL